MIPAYRVAIAGATVTTLALGWTWWRSSAAEESAAAAAAGRAELQRLGAPDPALVTAAEAAAVQQAKAVDEAAAVAPPIPEAYSVTDIASATKRVRDDLDALRLRGDRLGIPLPKPLPFEGGLDNDSVVRSTQLGFLHVIHLTLDHALDAGVKRVAKADTGKAWSDPSGTFACFSMELDVDATPAAIKALLTDLSSPAHGLALSHLKLEAPQADGSQRLTCTVLRLTRNAPEWKLQPEQLPAARTPTKSTPRGLGARP